MHHGAPQVIKKRMNDGLVAANGCGLRPAAWPASHSFAFGQADLVVSTVTLSCKVRPQARAYLDQAAREVNQVWNFCNAVTYRAWHGRYGGTRRWLSAYDLQPLLAGCGEVFDKIGIDVAQSVSAEHATRRNQFSKCKLRWRKSGGSRKSPGWIPFKPNTLRFTLCDARGKRVSRKDDPQPVIPAWPAKPANYKELLPAEQAAYKKLRQAFIPVRQQAESERLAWEARRVQEASVIKVSFLGKTIGLFNADHLLGQYRLAKQGAGCLRSGNFSQDAVGDWYLNVVVDRIELQLAPVNGSNSSIGYDPGFKASMTGSDGSVLESGHYRNLEPEIAQAQKTGHKKKAKRLNRKARRQRADVRNKFCRSAVDDHARLWVGNLSAHKMARSGLRGHGKSVHDAAFGAAYTTLEAMGRRAGRVVEKVNECNSTRRCSSCQALTGPAGLDACVVRQWACAACGTVHDRDVCSGENLRHAGETGWQNRLSNNRAQSAAPRYWRPFAGTR